MAQTLIIEDKLAAWAASLPVIADRAGARVYPWVEAPQNGPFPYVLYHRIGGGRMRSLKGPTARVSQPRIQWDVVARSYADAREVAEALQLGLELLQGTVLEGRRIQFVRVRDVRDMATDPAHGDGEYEPRVMLDTELWFEEG